MIASARKPLWSAAVLGSLRLALFSTSILASFGATLTWDVVTGDGATITEGNGTWDGGTARWNNGVANTVYVAGSDVILGGGGSGTTSFKVSINNNINANSLTFNPGARYEVESTTGKVITLTSGNISVASGVTAFIDADLFRSAGITKQGEGTLELVNNGFIQGTGVTTVNAGQLHLNSGASAVENLLIQNPSSVVKFIQGGQIRDPATVTLSNGGSLDMGTFGDRINTLNLSSGNVAGSGTLIVDNAINLQSGTIGVALQGGSLTKSSSGTAILSGNS